MFQLCGFRPYGMMNEPRGEKAAASFGMGGVCLSRLRSRLVREVAHIPTVNWRAMTKTTSRIRMTDDCRAALTERAIPS